MTLKIVINVELTILIVYKNGLLNSKLNTINWLTSLSFSCDKKITLIAGGQHYSEIKILYNNKILKVILPMPTNSAFVVEATLASLNVVHATFQNH